MHTKTIKVRRGHEFEGEWEGLQEALGGGEGRKKNTAIKL